MFYTAAYHSLIMPTIFSDADGRYRGFDHQIHQADGFQFYSDLSLWDTFRTLHPWLTLVYPEVQRDIVISLLKMYEQDGFLPIWPVSPGRLGNDDRRQRGAGDRRFLRQGPQGLRHGRGVRSGHALRPRAEPARLDLPRTPPHRRLSQRSDTSRPRTTDRPSR